MKIPFRNFKSGKSAFTLIELLVVIAIIAILAAILFPVFGRARENARRSSCLSNLKQIGLGIMQYTQDYDEKYPLGMWFTDWGNSGTYAIQTDPSMPGAIYKVSDGTGALYNAVTWMDITHPYVKSTQIYRCPSQNDPASPSYGYNRWINRIPGGGPPLSPISASTIQRSSEIVMIMDLNTPYSIYANAYEFCGTNLNLPESRIEVKQFWPHFTGGTVTFADGHAKWYIRGSRTICAGADPTSNQGNPAWWPEG